MRLCGRGIRTMDIGGRVGADWGRGAREGADGIYPGGRCRRMRADRNPSPPQEAQLANMAPTDRATTEEASVQTSANTCLAGYPRRSRPFWLTGLSYAALGGSRPLLSQLRREQRPILRDDTPGLFRQAAVVSCGVRCNGDRP